MAPSLAICARVAFFVKNCNDLENFTKYDLTTVQANLKFKMDEQFTVRADLHFN